MKKIISILLALTLIAGICMISASAEEIILLGDEDTESRIAERFDPDTPVKVTLTILYRGSDYAGHNAAVFDEIAAVIPEAKWDPQRWSDRNFMEVTIPAGDFTKLSSIKAIVDAMLYIADPLPLNEDGTADILIVYGCSMSEAQQKQYDDGDWTAKMAILEECYAESKADMLTSVGKVCEYQVLHDTSINRIYLRVPATAVDDIKKAEYVRSVSYRTLSDSKLNDEAQKLIAEADPGQTVSVLVWTDRGDVVCIRDYLNMTKQEFNSIRVIEDENGVTEHRKINHAYYNAYNQKLVSEITAKTDAVFKPYMTYHPEDGTYSELEYDMYMRFDIPVGQIESLAQIEGVSGITYEPPKEPDPLENWYELGGDLDLARKMLGEPNEYGWFYVPLGFSLSMLEDEYARFKEIDYVKGIKYCRPAPDDGWWQLEGDEALLKATYGEPRADGRYYVPKKDAVKGDVDYDYDLTILDATGIQRELASLGAEHFNALNADYDEDGDMTILDATGIQRTLVNLY